MTVVVVSIAWAFVVAWLLMRPHLHPAEGVSLAEENPELVSLADQKARCLQVLKDLELDYAMSKISAQDNEQTKAQIKSELSTILTKLDQHKHG